MTPKEISFEEAKALLPDWSMVRVIFEQRPNTGDSYPALFERKEILTLLKRSPRIWRSGETGIRLRLGIYIQTVHPKLGFGQLFFQTVEPDAEEPLMIQYAIYDHPKDFPEGYVVREWWIMQNRSEPLPGMCGGHDTLEKARASLPDGLTKIARHPDDDPTLIEAWV